MFSLSQVTRLLCLYILRCILFGTRMHSSGVRTACLLTVCVCMGGGICPGGVCPGVCLPGGVCPVGVSSWWGMFAWGVSAWAGVCLGQVSAWGGVPCDLSHHAFDVTCMLPPHQLRPSNNAAAYILLVGHVTCKACWDTPPPPDRQTPVKT